ncbi:hypothetical protein BROUX41_002245 [Berkeleyomyces rouxiae]
MAAVFFDPESGLLASVSPESDERSALANVPDSHEAHPVVARPGVSAETWAFRAANGVYEQQPETPIMQRSRPRPRRDHRFSCYSCSSASDFGSLSLLPKQEGFTPDVDTQNHHQCGPFYGGPAQGSTVPSAAPSYSTGVSFAGPDSATAAQMRQSSCATAPSRRVRNVSPYPFMTPASLSRVSAFDPPTDSSASDTAGAESNCGDESASFAMESSSRGKEVARQQGHRRANTMSDSGRQRSNSWYSSVVSAIRNVGEPNDDFARIGITGQLRLSSPSSVERRRSSGQALSRFNTLYRRNSLTNYADISSLLDETKNTQNIYDVRRNSEEVPKLTNQRQTSETRPLVMAPISSSKGNTKSSRKPRRTLKNLSESILTKLRHSDQENADPATVRNMGHRQSPMKSEYLSQPPLNAAQFTQAKKRGHQKRADSGWGLSLGS